MGILLLLQEVSAAPLWGSHIDTHEKCIAGKSSDPLIVAIHTCMTLRSFAKTHSLGAICDRADSTLNRCARHVNPLFALTSLLLDRAFPQVLEN